MCDQEEWFDIAPELGFSRYQVTKSGKIRNRNSGYVFQKKPDNEGYIQVGIINDVDQRKNMYLHRLIAYTFIGKPMDNQYTVDHINNKRDDNRIENLRWATPSEQKCNQRPIITRTRKAIYQLDMNGDIIKKWNSAEEAIEILGLGSSHNIRSACRGDLQHSYGYKWIYCNDYNSDIDDEIWKETPYTDIYVSNIGRVRHGRKILSGTLHEKGYRKVGFRTNGKTKYIYVHQLVCRAFNGEPLNERMIINHKDGNKQNNCAGNLEWITQSENVKHAYDIGLISMRGRQRKVHKIDLDSNIVAEYDSISQAAQENQKSVSYIRYWLEKDNADKNGFIWQALD